MNTLIKSVIDQKSKAIFKTIIISFFVLSALIVLFLLQGEDRPYYIEPRMRFYLAFHGDGTYLALFIVAICSLIWGISSLIVFCAHSKCELTVSENEVRGRAAFGQEVVLPLHMISTYKTRSFMSTITIATASGLVSFDFIENYAEIGAVLSKLIANRQSETVNAQAKPNNSSNMDDLVKLKSLLDSGIITQEEFEAKKKQLLGL